jgi:hypothetical protein
MRRLPRWKSARRSARISRWDEVTSGDIHRSRSAGMGRRYLRVTRSEKRATRCASRSR